jgi:SAM-dependent methyltransferase
MTARAPIAVRFLTYEDVRALPGVDKLDALTRVPVAQRPAAWDAWVRQRAVDVNRRLQQGEEDSLAYLLLYGTSFTTAPRVTREFLEVVASGAAAGGSDTSPALARAFDARMTDLLRALQSPGRNDRFLWAAATLARLGYRLDTDTGRTKAAEYLLKNLSRVMRESTELSQALAASDRNADREAQLAQRARLFSQRGLAPDTSWPINFAIDAALRALKPAAPRGPISRVAIVGPGLDFVDKDEGYDFYPPQSLQPFAVVDAIAGAGLASATGVRVTTIDVSARVNDHLKRLVGPGGRRPFDLQLVRDPLIAWTPDATQYWSGFGASIGTVTTPVDPPSSVRTLERRAIRVRPDVIGHIAPIDANIVYQRIMPTPDERFDLVVATNVLLYYDAFEQMLAASNIAALLAPDGLFLTNTKLDDLPAFPLERVAESSTAFSSRPGDGEYVFSYRRRR